MDDKTRHPRLRALAVALAAASAAGGAQASEWQIEPGMTGIVTLSDNNRQSSGGDTTLAATLSPNVAVTTAEGGPLKASAFYRLNAISRFGGNYDNADLTHNFSGIGRAEIVNDLFYIDATANYSQPLVSLLSAPSDQNVNLANRANTAVYSIAPNLSKRFGSFATGHARYTIGGSSFQNGISYNSTINSLEASLVSGSAFGNASWGVDYSLRKSNYSRYADTTFERYGVSGGYLFSREFRLSATAGQDKNTYPSAQSQGGPYYTLGMGWAPNQRASIEINAGHRYFGPTYGLSADYRTRKTTWNASYSQDISDISKQLLGFSSSFYYVCPGGPTGVFLYSASTPTAPLPGCAGPFNAQTIDQNKTALGLTDADLVAAGIFQNTGLTRGVYVYKTFNAGVNWAIDSKLGLGFSLTDSKRNYQLFSNVQDRISTANLAANYRFTRDTSASAGVGLTRITVPQQLQTGPAIDRRDTNLYLSLGATHRFSQDLSGTLYWRHYKRSSNDSLANYDENNITATFALKF